MKKIVLGLMVLYGVVFAENKMYFTEIIANNTEDIKAVVTLSSSELNEKDIYRLTEMFKKAKEELQAKKIILKIESISQ